MPLGTNDCDGAAPVRFGICYVFQQLFACYDSDVFILFADGDGFLDDD